MRRCRPKQKAGVGEFRRLRGVPDVVNVRRFVAHVTRALRLLRKDRSFALQVIKQRRRRRTALAARRRA